MAISGVEAFIQMLAEGGVRYLFGNPGTTELPLMDALAGQMGSQDGVLKGTVPFSKRKLGHGEPKGTVPFSKRKLGQSLEYILALQEVPAVAIADGYAQASGALGVVNLHACCGLGNGMGMLYNAYREGTPLLVTAGQQDQRMMFEEPILWGDMVSTVRPWTKWADEVRRVEDLPSAVRRAFQAALAPPTGPVFLSLPLDVQTARAELDLTPPRIADLLVRPPAEALRRAAAVLGEAKNPAILVGSRICEADAVAELVDVAERLGAPVMHEATTSHGRMSFPCDHPLAAMPLPFWSPEVRDRLAPHDVVLVAGMKLLQQYIYHEPSRAVPEHVRLVQLDDDAWELSKNYPLEVALIGHPKPALSELAVLLDSAMTSEQKRAARQRLETHGRRRAGERETLRREAQRERDTRPMTPLCLMDTLVQILPRDVAVIEEAPTTTMSSYFEGVGALKNTSGYFAQRGWALGWGLNCAIGVKLAWPDRPVLALIGDGSAMYGIAGLWTAAHYRLPVTFVIANNCQYKILKNCAQTLNLPEACAGRFEGLDLTDPEIDFVALAQSQGVAACRVAEPEAVAQAVSEALSADAPRLIEVPIQESE